MPQIHAAGSPRPSQRPAPFHTATNVSCTASATDVGVGAAPAQPRGDPRRRGVVQLPERAAVAVGDRGQQLLVGPHALPRPSPPDRQFPGSATCLAPGSALRGEPVLTTLTTTGMSRRPAESVRRHDRRREPVDVYRAFTGQNTRHRA